VKLRKVSEIQVLALVLGATVLGFWLMDPHRFLTVDRLQSMAFQLPELGLLSLAMMVVMVSGGIDLSIVATANLASIVTALVLQRWFGGDAAVGATVVAVSSGLLASLAVGCFNGLLIGRVGVSPILVTLGTMTLVEGLSLVLTGGGTLSGLPASIAPIGRGAVWGVPVPLLIFAACAVGVAVLLRRSPWGFRLYLFGANPTATLFSGVNNRRVVLLVYALSGLLCGIAGMVMLSGFNSAKADYGESYLLITILAVVLGGTSPTGGFGRVAGLVLALMILQVISSGLNLFRASGSLTIAIWGAIILLVMTLNLFMQYLERRSLAKEAKSDLAGT